MSQFSFGNFPHCVYDKRKIKYKTVIIIITCSQPKITSEWRLVNDMSWSSLCVFTQFGTESYIKNKVHATQCKLMMHHRICKIYLLETVCRTLSSLQGTGNWCSHQCRTQHSGSVGCDNGTLCCRACWSNADVLFNGWKWVAGFKTYNTDKENLLSPEDETLTRKLPSFPCGASTTLVKKSSTDEDLMEWLRGYNTASQT